MCTTSAECRTVMTVMFMVMSGMDSHIPYLGWYGGDVGSRPALCLGRATTVFFVVCLMSCLEEKSF
jgi:hypothetical protein